MRPTVHRVVEAVALYSDRADMLVEIDPLGKNQSDILSVYRDAASSLSNGANKTKSLNCQENGSRAAIRRIRDAHGREV
jgi:hypothetical protein